MLDVANEVYLNPEPHQFLVDDGVESDVLHMTENLSLHKSFVFGTSHILYLVTAHLLGTAMQHSQLLRKPRECLPRHSRCVHVPAASPPGKAKYIRGSLDSCFRRSRIVIDNLQDVMDSTPCIGLPSGLQRLGEHCYCPPPNLSTASRHFRKAAGGDCPACHRHT